VTVVEQEPLDHDVLSAEARAAVNDDSICICQMTHTNYYSPKAKHVFGRIMETVYGAKNGVDAFGYYSTESERIWMKSGAL